MGSPAPPQPPQGLCFAAPSSWPWGTGEQQDAAWWTEGMEGVEASESGGPPGLRFLLQLDPGRSPGLDRTLLGFSLSALLSRLLGWSSKDGHRRGGSVAIAGEEEGSGNAGVSAAALAAAVSLSLAAVLASSDQRPRRAPPPPLPRRRLRLPAPDSGAPPIRLVRLVRSHLD